MGPRAFFHDRREAGRRLAERLRPFADQHPVVLALPRGGVPVGYEIAHALEAPLDLVLVRKIGAPFQPELALGAVVDGGRPETVVNHEIVRELGITDAEIDAEAARQLEEIERRRRRYLAGRPREGVAGRTAIVVDDGIATGATMAAALHATRRAAPTRLVMAVPVAPAETIERLRPEVDEVVCLATPTPFMAIGMFYRRFDQVDDEDVVDLLRRSTTGDRQDEPLASPAREGPACP